MPSEPGTPDTLSAQPTPQKALANREEAWPVLTYINLQAPEGPHPSMRAPHLSWGGGLYKAFPTPCCMLGILAQAAGERVMGGLGTAGQGRLCIGQSYLSRLHLSAVWVCVCV